MKRINTFVELINADEQARLLACAKDLLADPGMRIESSGMRAALASQGAIVDENAEIVSFPKKMIDEVIELAVAEEGVRYKGCEGNVVNADGLITFSWHSSFMTGTPTMQASLGGGCPLYYDYVKNDVRYAGENDLVRMLHLAEGMEEIVTCGNAVHCVLDKDGNTVPSELMAIVGAATIAKNSSKPGSSALMSAWQLLYLIEMGQVVRDGPENYRAHPVFININDTMPPMQLSAPEAEIIEALAKRRLPVYILPMPLMAIAGPATVLANAAIGTAEILGAWAGVKAIDPETPIEASVVSGVLDPRTGSPSFSAPEAISIDLAIAQCFRGMGLRCGTGVGFIDAIVPGLAAAHERTFKTTIAAMCGESAFPVGIQAAGNVFSPEQLMLDLDINTGYTRFLANFDAADLDEAVSLVRERGIGGSFLDTDHTLANFRRNIWIPKVFSRLKTNDPKDAPDPVADAHLQWQDMVTRTDPFCLPDDKAREIDKIVASAKEYLNADS